MMLPDIELNDNVCVRVDGDRQFFAIQQVLVYVEPINDWIPVQLSSSQMGIIYKEVERRMSGYVDDLETAQGERRFELAQDR